MYQYYNNGAQSWELHNKQFQYNNIENLVGIEFGVNIDFLFFIDSFFMDYKPFSDYFKLENIFLDSMNLFISF